jgi:hypothetical protein
MYVAVILTEESRQRLLMHVSHYWKENPKFVVYADHMTLHMGKAKESEIPLLDNFANLVVDAVAYNDLVVAARVSFSDVLSDNPVPHITLAVNKEDGGKPVMSNGLTDWEPLKEPIMLRGKVEEVE